MILIATKNTAQTIIRYRDKIRGLSMCRLRGTLDGEACRIVPYHLIPDDLDDVTVIWDDCEEKPRPVIKAGEVGAD